MTWQDVRFNQNSKYLYVTAMGWPENGTLTIRALAEGSALLKSKIRSVELLGYGRVRFRRTGAGLEVSLPKPVNKIAPVLKIRK